MRRMRCDEARYRVSLGLDSRLSEDERAELETHLLQCAPCAAFRSDAQGLRERMRPSPVPDPGPAFTAKVMDGLDSPPLSLRKPAALRWGAAAAAAAVLVAAGVLVMALRPRGKAPDAASRELLVEQAFHAWLFFSQVAHLTGRQPAEEIRLTRQELTASGLAEKTRRAGVAATAGGSPEDRRYLDRCGALIARVQETTELAEASRDSVERLRAQVVESGLLAELEAMRASQAQLAPVEEISWTPPEAGDPAATRFLAGRGRLHARDFGGAAAEFERAVALAPVGEFADDALYWLAFARERQGRTQEALGSYYSLCFFDSGWVNGELLAQAGALSRGLAGSSADVPIVVETTDGKGQWRRASIPPETLVADFKRRAAHEKLFTVSIAIVVQDDEGRMYRLRNLQEFARKLPYVYAELRRTAPQMLERWERTEREQGRDD